MGKLTIRTGNITYSDINRSRIEEARRQTAEQRAHPYLSYSGRVDNEDKENNYVDLMKRQKRYRYISEYKGPVADLGKPNTF